MRCGSCGAETTVLESRKRDGGVYRRRWCSACDCRFSTLETVMRGLKPGPKPAERPAPPPTKPKAAKPAQRKADKPVVKRAPASNRLHDYWMRGEPHDYTEDLREAGIDTAHFG